MGSLGPLVVIADSRAAAPHTDAELARRGSGRLAAGAFANWLPFRATGLIAGRLSGTEDAWASLKLAAALVLFPLYWLVLAAATTLATSWRWGALVLLLTPLLGLWALRFRDHQRFWRQVRAFFLLAGGSGLRRHLEESRRAIHAEVEKLRAEQATDGRPA